MVMNIQDLTPASPLSRSAVELAEDLRKRRISSRELTTASLERIAECSELGAFLSVDADIALAQADAADQQIAAADGPDLLPLLIGMPTAHKDLVNAEGFTTTHGSLAVPHIVAEEDDPVVAATRAAGAVTVGKTQVPEFGIAGYSQNLVGAPSRNPLDPTRTSGGSSGGSAAAVASRMVPAVIASDAGGSIRIPAAACGLYGLKPGRNVTPADAWRGETDEFGIPTMGSYGPIAHDAADTALFYDALMGWQDRRAQTAVAQAESVTGRTIGVSLETPFTGWIDGFVSDDARQAVARAAERLESLGHTVVESDIRYTKYDDRFHKVWAAALGAMQFLPGYEEKLGSLAGMFRRKALSTPPEELMQAVHDVIAFGQNAQQQWAQYDYVLTPTMAIAPPRNEDFWAGSPEDDFKLQCEWVPHTSMVNVVGVPALSAPTFTNADGLSFGAHLIGKAGDEIELLQLAKQLEGLG